LKHLEELDQTDINSRETNEKEYSVLETEANAFDAEDAENFRDICEFFDSYRKTVLSNKHELITTRDDSIDGRLNF
jgi:hypothetical protein